MARSSPQPLATKAKGLKCSRRKCPSCGSSMWHAYDNYRQVRTLQGAVQLQLQIRRCPNLNVSAIISRIALKLKVNGPCPSKNLAWMSWL